MKKCEHDTNVCIFCIKCAKNNGVDAEWCVTEKEILVWNEAIEAAASVVTDPYEADKVRGLKK